MTVTQFLEWESGAPSIDYKPAYCEVVGGDIAAALLLSQIVFWYLPIPAGRKRGKSKVKVERDGRTWIAKRKNRWRLETGLKRAAFDRALGVLERFGLVVHDCFHFNDRPALHISLNIEVFYDRLEEVLNASESDD